MSRSKRKTKIIGVCGGRHASEKIEKQLANRKFRRVTKTKLFWNRDAPLKLREVSNVWSFSKDGKYYWHDMPPRYIRK